MAPVRKFQTLVNSHHLRREEPPCQESNHSKIYSPSAQSAEQWKGNCAKQHENSGPFKNEAAVLGD